MIRDLSKYDYIKYASDARSIDFGLYDGLIIRVYDGTDPDPMFTANKNGAIATGKPWFPYQFYDWFFPARPQVHAALDLLGIDRGCQPAAFDVEQWNGYAYPAREKLLAGMFDLYDEYLKATSQICQFYLNVSCMIYLSPIPDWLAACPLWIADWRGQANPGPLIGWKTWRYWQVQGDPDLSRFNGTMDQFNALWKTMPIPQTTKSKVLVTATALNVRAGPGTNYGILEAVAKGTILEVQDIGGQDAWVKVILPDGKIGWMCVQQNSWRFVSVNV